MRISRRNFVTSQVVLGTYWSSLPNNQAQETNNSSEPDLINDLVAANHFLADKALVDGYGHVSVRDPANPDRYLMARDLAPALVTGADILTYDLDSKPLNANGVAVVNERFIHGEIYKLRPDVKAVIHAHAAEFVAFSSIQVPMRPISHMAAFMGAGTPVFEIRTARDRDDKSMLIHTAALGQALARTLGGDAAVLIRGHGAAIVGSSLGQAVGRSVYLEKNAIIQRRLLALGSQINYLSAEEARAMGDNSYYRDWEVWRRWTRER